MDVVHECNEAWEKLMTGKTPSGGIATYVFSLVPSSCIATLLTKEIAPT